MNDLDQTWINIMKEKCSKNEQFLTFLSFIETSNAKCDICEDNIETLEQERNPFTYGKFYIGAVEIRVYLFQEDCDMRVRVGIDYLGHWNKFYDCIIETYFPMSRRDYTILEREIIKMIGDVTKGKEYYRYLKKRNSKKLKVDRRKGGGGNMSEPETIKDMQELIDQLDKKSLRFGFQAKLNGMGNSWIYHQLRIQIEMQDERLQPYLLMWLDNRWGEYKLY